MPKKQSTAAKKARAAARNSGAKYTAVLRGIVTTHLPAHLELFDGQALPDDERMVVDCLRALAAEGRPLPVRVAKPDPEVVEARFRAEGTSVSHRWQRWASVEAAADGYVLRESQYGPNRSGYTSTNRGPRVPVPVRAADGTVTVVAMPEWARLEGFQWVWAHTGWPVEAPGRIVDPPQDFSPAPGLRWQVAVWVDLGREDGRVLGEDYGGSSGGWQTIGWCVNRDDAREIARAYAARGGHYARADVIKHGADNGIVSLTTDSYLATPDASERTRPTTIAGPRPSSPSGSEVPEPVWYRQQGTPPNSSLVVWTGTIWRTLVWTDWQTRNIAAVLGIGAGGPYEWAEAWGPRHPDRHLHDWTQEGRQLRSKFPEPTYQEDTELIDAGRRAREEALVDALAERGGLTRKAAAARLEAGGQKYRDFLRVGMICIMDALNEKRRAAEGDERLRMREALDALEERHQADDWVVELTRTHMATNRRDEHFTDGSQEYREQALREYLAPGKTTA